MCGIVGYVGRRNARDVIIHGLEILEYRGYDSAGLAIAEGGRISVVKKTGYVARLAKATERMGGGCGIGHTRWATHGAPSEINCHPHTAGKFTVVHNGIIENFAALKKRLESKGRKFLSDTDTEVAACLMDDLYKGDPTEALAAAMKKLKGAFAFAVLCADRPGEIFLMKRHSPLVVGLGDGECFAASDCSAFCGYTDTSVFMKDGEIGVMGEGVFTLYDGNLVKKTVRTEKIDGGAPCGQPAEDFMKKEIFETPAALRDTVNAVFGDDNLKKRIIDIFSKNDKVVMTGCGTAYNACLMGKSLFERVLRVPVEAEFASEFRYKNPIVDDKTVVVAVSQSGETADTLAAVRLAKSLGADVVALTNAGRSAITREADLTLLTAAGPERAVAATKSYSAQAAAFLCVATVLSYDMKTVEKIREEICCLPSLASKALASAGEVKALAALYGKKRSVFFIGRGPDYALAVESSLKLKEVSYVHSEGFAAGELKHGTLALIDRDALVIAIVTQRHTAEKTLSALYEVKARGGKIMIVTPFDDLIAENRFDAVIKTPPSSGLTAPVTAMIPLQLFAYYMSKERGINPDKPRNLAKSVTVE